MAGTIVISPTVRFASSSRPFDCLTERIGVACQTGDEALKEEVFQPMHGACMDFITTRFLGCGALMRFRAIILQAARCGDLRKGGVRDVWFIVG